MKTAILYMTRYGTTENVARKLQKKLKGGADLINIKDNSSPNISKYDRLIIGGSIYAGTFSTRFKTFLKNNIEKIYDKKIALFMLCMYEGIAARKQFEDNFPKLLQKKSVANGYFGGKISLSKIESSKEKLNPDEKFAVWMVGKSQKTVNQIHEEEIERFAAKLNKE